MNPRINRGVLQPTFSIVSKIYKYLQEITKLSKYEKNRKTRFKSFDYLETSSMRHAYKRKKLELRFDRTENRKGSGAWTAAMFHPTNSNIGPLQDHNASSPRVSNSRSSLDRVCPGMNKVEPCVHTRRFSSDLGHVFLLCPVISSCTSHNASTLYSLQLSPNDLSVAPIFLATRMAITSLNRCFPRWKS